MPRLPEIDKILGKYICSASEDAKIPGAAFVVVGRDGSILHSSAIGSCKPGTELPFTPDTVCFIASMTKLVTSIATMQIVEQNLVHLDDDLAQIIPDLSKLDVLQGFEKNGEPILNKRTKPITLRHLLSHSSGFAYDVFDPELIRWRKWTGSQINSNSFSYESLKIPLKFQPGEGWVYGIGLDWAGRVVEVLTHQTLEDYMQSNIFGPLGMDSTTFRVSEHLELESKRAILGSRAQNDGRVSTTQNYKPDVTSMDCGGVGLYSTAADYAKLLAALIKDGGNILKPETVHELLNWQLSNPQSVQKHLFGEHHAIFAPEFPMDIRANYGLCGAINLEDIAGRRRRRSLMWHGITNSRWWVDHETGIAATLFVQMLPPGDTVVTELYERLEQAVYRSVTTNEPEVSKVNGSAVP